MQSLPNVLMEQFIMPYLYGCVCAFSASGGCDARVSVNIYELLVVLEHFTSQTDLTDQM